MSTEAEAPAAQFPSDAFQQAADTVKKLKSSPNNTELLELYALFKQVTAGELDPDVEPRPSGMLAMEARAKWDARKELIGIDPVEAQTRYITLVRTLAEKYGLPEGVEAPEAPAKAAAEEPAEAPAEKPEEKVPSDTFQEAADTVKKLKTSPSNTELLELYALFKQVTAGELDPDVEPRPSGMLAMEARAKWDARKELIGIDRVEAQTRYIALVRTLADKYGLPEGVEAPKAAPQAAAEEPAKEPAGEPTEEAEEKVPSDAFQEAADTVKKLKTSPSNKELLELYALFKQVTVGDLDPEAEKRPSGMFAMEGRAKWDARKELIGTDRLDAQRRYITLVKTLVEKYGLRD